MKATILCAALAAFALLHHDFWFWRDAGLVFGFLPAGLAYHAGYSVATAVLWGAVGWLAWPASEPGSPPEPPGEDAVEGPK